MRKFNIKDLLDSEKLPKLEKQNEYMLHLYNNNYSNETIYNYNRDLSFFAEFLLDTKTSFNKVNKLAVTFYKGWLKQRSHVKKIRESKSLTTDTAIDVKTASKSNEDILGVQLPTRKEKKVMQKGGYVKNNNPDELGPLSINRVLVALRNYLRFLVEYDYETPIAPDAVQLVRVPKKKPQIPTLDEVVALVEAPTYYEEKEIVALRNRAALELLLATGMRISEVVSINRDQISSTGKLFIMGKGRKERFVYLTPRSVNHIQEYLVKRGDSYPALFVPTSGSRMKSSDPRISTNYLQMKIAHYRRMLEIIVPMSAHSIRHAYATYLAENGANPAAIQVLLGHESLQTTTRYVHASDKFAEQTHKKHHPALEE